jgi:hypothetical protein
MNHQILPILGAGFSASAGLPLTMSLFDEIPNTPFEQNVEMFKQVKLAWKMSGKGKSVEQWIKEIYMEKDNLPTMRFGVSWEDVQDFILARLVSIPSGKNSHYYHGISTSISSEIHRKFWGRLRGKYNVKTILTTNYDILIEQGLKDEYTKERKAPICYYGGYPYNQVIRKMTNVSNGSYEELKLGHEIELIKLHGSLNWVDEPHGYKIHDDVRAVFRKSRELGKPRIIPPLEEKEQPKWAFDIWERAKKALRENSNWFICGYSFPIYDKAINAMISDCAQSHQQLNIIISDPFASNVESNLKNLLPKNTSYHLEPGLPEWNNS